MKQEFFKIAVGTLAGVTLFLAACGTVRNVDAADTSGESSMVFVRPGTFSILGTRSLADYVEVAYEDVGETETGRMTVACGVRNRGGQHWYDLKGPQVTIGAKIAFYAQPDRKGKPLWVSPRKTVLINRGDTTHLEFICPKAGAKSYQITLSDYEGVRR